LDGGYHTYVNPMHYNGYAVTTAGAKSMSVEHALHQLLQLRTLGVPKQVMSYHQVVEHFGPVSGETAELWFIPCRHEPHPPASPQQLLAAEQALERPLPQALRSLLTTANGGKFCILPSPDLQPEFSEQTRYPIFSTDELISINRWRYDQFRLHFVADPDLRHLQHLNYIAFGDAHNGDHLVLIDQGPLHGRVFVLDYEALSRPYRDQDAEFYHPIADTLESWLEQIVQTHAWNGFGEKSKQREDTASNTPRYRAINRKPPSNNGL
jgi:SMI1/KNR4 family protein SUKH-1